MGGKVGESGRSLGLFDTTMLVMGGIVGSGIFMNPQLVAREVPSAIGILAAWAVGGAVALVGGFVWAELAARRPGVGGQYAYLRDGVAPSIGFAYGWSNLLVVQTGGLAAVAVTFARYAHVLVAAPWGESATAAAALAGLTAVNLLGVRAGGRTQSVLMALKILAILTLILGGLWLAPAAGGEPPHVSEPLAVSRFFVALIAVVFAYGGWATATFAAAEIRNSTRTLPRALLVGSVGVVVLYLGVNIACLRTLGVEGLAASDAPASAVMRAVLGAPGETFIALAVTVSTLGFLAQGMLVCPRVYFAMARDGAFFETVGRLHPATGVPYVAVLLQGVLAIVTALTGSYEEILSWVVTVDFVFLAATAGTLFVFRARNRSVVPSFRATGHPLTTILFILVCLAVVAATFVEHPGRSALGWLLVAAGFPVYFVWRRRANR